MNCLCSPENTGTKRNIFPENFIRTLYLNETCLSFKKIQRFSKLKICLVKFSEYSFLYLHIFDFFLVNVQNWDWILKKELHSSRIRKKSGQYFSPEFRLKWIFEVITTKNNRLFSKYLFLKQL